MITEGGEMTAMIDSRVLRGGVTQSRLKPATSRGNFTTFDNTVQIDFNITAAGDGFTHIRVFVGPEDFRAMVLEAASVIPDFSTTLFEALAIAHKQELERLREEIQGAADSA